MRQMLAGAAILLVTAGPLSAQPSAHKTKSHTARSTLIGVAAGLAVGLWIGYGMHVFEDTGHGHGAIWTLAASTAAAGGVIGSLLADRHTSAVPARRSTIDSLSPVEIRRLSRMLPTMAPDGGHLEERPPTRGGPKNSPMSSNGLIWRLRAEPLRLPTTH
jgi:hypothetical protein